MTPEAPMTGGCQCGAVRYEITGAPLELYVCHCVDCRKQSASAFGMSMMVSVEDFRLTQGEVKRWTRPTDSGNRLNCYFCGNCGSRLWHQGDTNTTSVTVKPGSLDVPIDFSNAVHIWTKRKIPGFDIPEGAVQFEGEPE